MAVIKELKQLLDEQGLDAGSTELVLAAVDGPDALDDALAGRTPGQVAEAGSAPSPAVPGTYLSSIEVTGFRGIGPQARLELTEGPGLTVVVGRNGSGKSSFVEALEVLLTGDSWRWRNKAAEWKHGWRNLHHPNDARAVASFSVEGSRGRTTLTRSWQDDASDVSSADTVVQPNGAKQTDLDGIGWVDAIDLYRPLLSHPELAEVASEPSRLFDALYGVLGLDELTSASELLRKHRLERQAPLKQVKKDHKELVATLEAAADDRARAVLTALEGRTWDLEAAADAVVDSHDSSEELSALDGLARLEVPSADAVEKAAVAVEIAHDRLKETEGTEAGRAGAVADILEAALDHHHHHGDQPCPVCGQGSLGETWRKEASERLVELRRIAADFDRAVVIHEAAVSQARNLVGAVPNDLARYAATADNAIDVGGAVAAWDRWSETPAEPAGLPEHLRTTHSELASAVTSVVEQAAKHRAELDEAWRPIARRVAGWVAAAHTGLDEDEKARTLKRAEDALNSAIEELRSRRFEPISSQAIALWQALRLQSNVDLVDVELAGKGTRRRVDLKVTVDGAEGSALGVVSQGEVNCLALSLFFPRVMLPDSPFRFVVIDDPVQAMDPARVDGLAQVLVGIAESHQLVVFTHDDRLPASLRRLGLAHTVLEVTRRPGSVVEVRKSIDPVNQYFADARAVEKDDNLPSGVASRVVPGFCRSALEAACMEAVRRRRIGRGDPHLAVEKVLDEARRTTSLAALALFDDPAQGGKVLGEINSKWGRGAGDVYRDVQKGTHKGFQGSLPALIEEAERLAAGLRAMR